MPCPGKLRNLRGAAAAAMRIPIRSTGSSQKGILAVFEAPPNFGHGVLSFVLVFDIGLDVVLPVSDEPEDLLNRSITWAERYVWPLLALPVLKVHHQSSRVVLPQEEDRIESRGDEMPEIERET